jgi:spermidine synthase
MKERNLKSARVIALGACAVSAQTLFIREILGLLAGTELAIGLALASWLFWIGIGGLLGGLYLRSRADLTGGIFSKLSILLAISVPLIVLLIRLGRGVLVDPPGSMPPPVSSAVFALAALAPFGLIYGSVYNAASLAMRNGHEGIRGGIASVYILEAAGSIAGAVLLTLVFFSLLTQIEASFAVALTMAAVFLATSRRGGRAGWIAASILLAAGFAASPAIDSWSLSTVFRGYEIEEVVPSRYAELCVAREDGTVSVFSGGARLLSYPDPERIGEDVHIPLLAHHAPSRILMLGGAPGGGLEEAMAHPGVKNVEWVELDGRFSEAVERSISGLRGNKNHASKASAAETGLIGDGRLMLRDRGGYDMILVDAPDPLNLRWNRYFTREFFETAKRSLAPGGALSVRHGSSENFISQRHAAVLGIVYSTLSSVFAHIGTVPGGTVFFICSDDPVDVAEMPSVMRERNLEHRFLALDNLPYRLTADRRMQLAEALEAGEKRINTDLHPILVPFELVLHQWRSGSAAAGAIALILRFPGWAAPVAVLSLALILCILARGKAAPRVAVFLTGFCSMTVQMAVLLAYQTFSGILYQNIVLLTALFMAGASAGAMGAGRMKRAGSRFLAAFHLLMALTALLVPLWLATAGRGLTGEAAGTAGFLVLSAAGGALTGMYYRKIVDLSWEGAASGIPAAFYSWDLFGACIGSLAAGIMLLPVSGVKWTMAMVVSIHLLSASLLTRRITASND